jgi:hypothetical protein
MTTLQLMVDGAVAAAELLALLFVSPAHACEPATAHAAAVFEQPIALHRLSTTVDVRLPGPVAGARVAHAVRNPSPADADESPMAGHVRLTEDEWIADALESRRVAAARIDAGTAQPVALDGPFARLQPPVDGGAPRTILLDAAEGPVLMLVPDRSAARATLVLRPRAGDSVTLHLGAVDAGKAVLVPLAGRDPFERLTAGAVELELDDGTTTSWSTLVLERPAAPASVQARHAD